MNSQTEIPNRSTNGIMRWLIVLAIALVAALSLAAYFNQQHWVEVLGNDLIHTNAPRKVVADAYHAVLFQHKNLIDQPDGTKSDPTFKSNSRSWWVGPSRDKADKEVIRGKTVLVDKNGHILSIETISLTNGTSLLFVEFSSPEGPLAIVNEVIKELQYRGVDVRR